MTAPFTGNRPGAQPGLPNLPEPPSGWPVGSYAKYEEAQRAVDHLADNEFPVADVTIVGVDLMLVERVIGRLTWGRVLLTGAASGAWLGLFVGLVLSLLAPVGSGFGSILTGLVIGIIFGVVSGAITYGASRGRPPVVDDRGSQHEVLQGCVLAAHRGPQDAGQEDQVERSADQAAQPWQVRAVLAHDAEPERDLARRAAVEAPAVAEVGEHQERREGPAQGVR